MRRWILLAGGAVALAASLVLLRGGPAPHRTRTVAPAHEETPRPRAPTPARTGAPAAAAAPVADVVAIAAPPDEVEFPPPTPDALEPRPERDEPTPTETSEQKIASLDLIARSIERLEKERQDAARAGDAGTERLNRIRIERLRRRSEAIEHELAGDEQVAP